MKYSSSVPVIIDLQLSVLLNPMANPNQVVKSAAKKMLDHGVKLEQKSGNAILMVLSVSERAYEALMLGVKKLELHDVL